MAHSVQIPRFYPILDTAAYEANGLPVVEAARVLIEAGVRILQYRHKDDRHQAAFTEDRFQQAKLIREMCGEADVLFIMNDRADFARLLECGVHIGQDDLPPAEARMIVGPDRMVGLSTHNEAQLQAAVGAPVDYVGYGPVFKTVTKQNPDPVAGLSDLPRLRSLTHLPLVAIGGIDLESALTVLDSGADSVAVISGLLPGPGAGLEAFRERALEWVRTAGIKSRAL